MDAGLALGMRVGLRFAAGGSPANERNFHAWANSAPGTGRALSRTVRHAVGPRGQRDSVYRHLGRIRFPELGLFWGDGDSVLPYVQAPRLAAALPGTRLFRFRACGHFPHLERPEVFASVLNAFLGHAVASAPENDNEPGR
jgi:pimeloyl-ACP methyl ester carboxylesterase